MADLFLSYPRAEWARAGKVAAALEAAGYSVAWDYPSWVGEPLIDAIDRERAAARAVVVLWTRTGVVSARLRVEARAAAANQRFVQARLEKVCPPAPFRTRPLADLAAWQGEAGDPNITVLLGLIARALEAADRPSRRDLGWRAWRGPVEARARQVAVCSLPLLALPLAFTSAQGLHDVARADALGAAVTPASVPASVPAANEGMDTDALLAATGLCVRPAESAPAEPPLLEPGPMATASIQDLTFDAIRGDLAAQYRLGLRLLHGDGVTIDEPQGLAWLQKSAESGHVPAQLALGDLYLADTTLPLDAPRAAQWFRRAAEAGDRDAQYNLGVMYLGGRGVDRDPDAARIWFEKAAEQDVVAAHYNLGVIFANGWGVAKDHPRALVHLTTAAEGGRADAAWALGLLLYEGDETVRDRAAAVPWFKIAARANHPNAQYILSVLHVKGEGVPRSHALAFVWLELAIANGADQGALREDLRVAMSTWQAEAAVAAVRGAMACLRDGLAVDDDAPPPADLVS